MKKVLIIAVNFPPGAAGGSVARVTKFVKYLPEFGYQPYVLTVDRHSTIKDEQLLEEIKGAKVFYTKGMKMFEMEKGIRSGLGEAKKSKGSGFKSKTFKVLEKIAIGLENFFFIPDRKILWNKRAFKMACEIIEKEGIGNLIVTTPPNSTFLVGKKLKKKYPNLNFIADYRDGWTYFLNFKPPTPIHKAINISMERKVLNTANSAVATTTRFVNHLKKLSKNPNIFLLTNGFDSARFSPPKQKPKFNHEKFTIRYLGSLKGQRTSKPFLKALSELIKEGQISSNEISVEFYGRLVPKETSLFEELGLSTVTDYKGFVPQSKYISKLETADALLLVACSPINIPAKAFEYLASRRPIIAIAPDGSLTDLFRKMAINTIAKPEDKEAIKKNILSLYNQWKEDKLQDNGIPYQKIAKFDRKDLTRRLALLLDKDYKGFKRYKVAE